MIAISATGLLPFRSARICRAGIFRFFGGRRTRIAGLLGLRGARLATPPGGRCAGIGLRVRSDRNGRNESANRGDCAERFQRVLQSRHFIFLLEPDGRTASGKSGSIADEERFASRTRFARSTRALLHEPRAKSPWLPFAHRGAVTSRHDVFGRRAEKVTPSLPRHRGRSQTSRISRQMSSRQAKIRSAGSLSQSMLPEPYPTTSPERDTRYVIGMP